ncbi:MAG: choice-of-anchor Q domain-containing protein, partial [Desulforhabdus sp.]|jgi:predicted outer membrane repeat protein|nr:choice-of-anchor Q domain-containing protein [Desulforhabdus sp.]
LSSDPTLTNVTFSSNGAYNDGGGIYNRGGIPSLTNVTFSANWAVNGGGMYNNALNDPDNYPQLRNVTFGYNMATNQGSGMYNGGEFIQKSKPICTNVIIAYSYGGRDCFGTLHTGSYYNLIQNEANSCGLADGAQGNIIGQDPLLGPLVNNGGFTLTHALLTDSPAIDTGSPYDYPATDQRDAARPQGARCDIGAYEFEVAPGSFNKTSPLNGTTGQSPGPTLSWGASSGATSYDYCVTTTSGSCGLWQSAGMSTQVTLSGLAGNSTYYWHVRANNGVGTTYSNGLWWSFTTNCMAGILPSLMLLLGE